MADGAAGDCVTEVTHRGSRPVRAWRVSFADSGREVVERGLGEFRRCLGEAIADGGPALIELVLPADADAETTPDFARANLSRE